MEFFAYVQGLGLAIDHLLPYANHRFCMRHLYANFKFKGIRAKYLRMSCGELQDHQMQWFFIIT
jgi:hypothetical protein